MPKLCWTRAMILLCREQKAPENALFDHVIESAKIGLRKPDPRIYRMMVDALGVDPRGCVYLDDLGVNLKPARDMGMTTIKVVNAPQTIAELEAATGLVLR
jgi:putative hydrolase of the HAD superfamily